MVKYEEDGQMFLSSDSRQRNAVEIGVDDPLVTIQALVALWSMDLEGGNYHSMMDVPENLVTVLRKHEVSDETIKKVLFDIVDGGGWM